jgi:hypothetical protein
MAVRPMAIPHFVLKVKNRARACAQLGISRPAAHSQNDGCPLPRAQHFGLLIGFRLFHACDRGGGSHTWLHVAYTSAASDVNSASI